MININIIELILLLLLLLPCIIVIFENRNNSVFITMYNLITGYLR